MSGLQRPISWEEDISRNTLDIEPFDNLLSPAQMAPEEFDTPARKRIEALLKNESLEAMIQRDTFPIPCPEDREGYAPGFDGAYWLTGLEDYLKVMQVAEKQNVKPQSVFDFGCASGRLIRHFAAQSNVSEIWGSDINRRHIRWLYEHLPQTVKPLFNHCIPSLPLPDGSIDIVTAFSVFTHIDTFETSWLAEIRRILSPNGFAYLTVHNEATWIALRDQIDNEANRLVQSIIRVDPEFKTQIQNDLPSDRLVYRFSQMGPYRAQVFHSNKYLENVWGRFFKVVQILDLHHVRQSVVVLQRR